MPAVRCQPVTAPVPVVPHDSQPLVGRLRYTVIVFPTVDVQPDCWLRWFIVDWLTGGSRLLFGYDLFIPVTHVVWLRLRSVY